MEIKTEEYYESLDKRSKEYKEYKASKISEGVGDTIEKITEATGIKSLVKSLFGEDCGCDERKVKLNKIFRYKTECLSEEEFTYLDELFKRLKGTISNEDQKKLIPIYNRVFHKKQKASSCAPCWVNIIKQLKQIYNIYIEEQLTIES